MADTHIHAPPTIETEPCGDLCIRTLAMPADTNGHGDIFGGWLLCQMDVAGGVFASTVAKSRTVTVAIEAMNFRKPVCVGDVVSVYANIERVGRTSITVHLEAWVRRRRRASR
jgi:acyl-CoA thioesterase YciA